MESLVQLVGYFAIVFAVSAGVAWILTSVRSGKWRVYAPAEGASVRVRAACGMYRSRFVEARKEGWVLSAPLSRDHYVPLRPGESVTVEAPTEGGVYLFKTEIISRDAQTHEFVIRKPSAAHRIDRREEPRLEDVSSLTVELEGEDAWLVDLSAGGAKIATVKPWSRGERVKLSLPGVENPVYAWVLDVMPAYVDETRGVEMRVRFEELFDLNSLKRKAAPVG